MNKLLYMAGVVLTTIAISSCEEESMNIGNSLTQQHDRLDVSAGSFDVQTRTIIADSVLSLSNTCYLGKVRDPETGADVTSELTTQFHLLENVYISPEDKILGRYADRAAADSCDLVLYLSSPFASKDSLTAMKMRVHEMSVPMEEGRRYYSNYDPVSHQMLRTDGLKKDKMFTYNDLVQTTTTQSKYIDNIRIAINDPYTDVNGVTYNNYGTYLMRQYYDHKENFRNSYVFIHNVCPGFFFQITDGLGFHSKITDIGLRVYYRVQGDTAVTNNQLTLAGTREVLQTTLITNDKKAIQALAAETTHTYIKSPAGLFTEVTLPVKAIKQGHDSDSLIASKIVFQRLNNESTDYRTLAVPSTLLMVQKDSLYSYFEDNKVPDNITSYYSSFGASNPNTYTFANISNLITKLWEMYQNGIKSDANWEAKNPDWNKVVLVPVKTTLSNSVVTGVENDMSLTSTRLIGGKDNPNAPIKIDVVYAKYQ
ncbi:MAG: DUF4270 domain-containing protein [Prevotella sp.]|nr:DUF4270 domain-containing protein [Prevotella sp.]